MPRAKKESQESIAAKKATSEPISFQQMIPKEAGMISSNDTNNSDSLPTGWGLRVVPEKCYNDHDLFNIMIVAENVTALGRGFGEALAFQECTKLGFSGRPTIRNVTNVFLVDAETYEPIAGLTAPSGKSLKAKYVQISSSGL